MSVPRAGSSCATMSAMAHAGWACDGRTGCAAAGAGAEPADPAAAAAGQYRAWHARTGDTEPVRARRNQCIRQRGPGHPQSGHRQQQPARAGAGGAGHPWLRQGR
ncbi:hypothetical protein G6F59_016222 [Rhizopus arrhizus]|nr:hypothetical protein G6F59_016222 [Rhizopus arrhizus]